MIKTILKKFLLLIAIIISLLLLLILFISTPSLWNRYVTYPRLEKQKALLKNQYKKPEQFIALNDYKGIFHAHTYWSHDSEGNIVEILDAAKKSELDFLFFSDHPHASLDSFPRSYYGNYDGILIEPGTEKNGLGVNPLDSVILDWDQDRHEFIKNIIANGGLVYYIHTEEPHDWTNPDYQAMEIYNIHTDIKDEKSILPILLNIALTGKQYRHWAFREFFDEQTDILANWDRLNSNRRISGIGAPDAHNNQNIRARYTSDGKVEWVGPDANTIEITKPGFKEKLLLKEQDKTGWAFRRDADPYSCSLHYVNNHVLSDTLSSISIKEHLARGHSFVSFEHLADATGFQYFTVNEDNLVTAIMGDSVKSTEINSFKAVSPFPVKFEMIKNGIPIDTLNNAYTFTYKGPIEKGTYRLGVYLKFDKKWLPWIYTNHIFVY